MAFDSFAKIERDPVVDDPPLLAALRRYWTLKCVGRTMPRRAEIVPTEIKAHLPYVFLVDVIEGGSDFRYRLVGTRLHGSFHSIPTGRLMSDVIAPFGEDALKGTLEAYRHVVASQAPFRIRGGGAVYAQGTKFFDAILMPLSDDGETVNMVFGGFFFEWDRDNQYRAAPSDTSTWSLGRRSV